MTELSWKRDNKSRYGETYPDGPWLAEPDKVQWVDEATGLDCLIHRGPSGALCGYVGVPVGHQHYGKDYDSVEPYPDVHGGLTFASGCQATDDPAFGICHVPEAGRPDDVWWLGFDCAHAGDFVPGHDDTLRILDTKYGYTYKDIDYVRSEVTSLARQLAGV